MEGLLGDVWAGEEELNLATWRHMTITGNERTSGGNRDRSGGTTAKGLPSGCVVLGGVASTRHGTPKPGGHIGEVSRPLPVSPHLLHLCHCLSLPRSAPLLSQRTSS